MPSRPLFLCLALVLALAAAPPARAKMIYTAPAEVVAAHAGLVVRARIDLSTRRAEVLGTYRGELSGTVEVQNLRDFSSQEKLPGALPPTEEAVLFLDELDGRYYLVETSSPAFIHPHASVLYLTPEGKVLRYGQFLSGVLQVQAWEGVSRADLERDLVTWLAAPRAPRLDRPSLSLEASKPLYDLLVPEVDLHRREVVAEPHRQRLVDTLAGLEALVATAHGELRHRAVEAMLVLAQQRGADQDRRGLVEARLLALLARLGSEPFVGPCLDEIRSPAIRASRETAAKLLRRIGGEPRADAKAALLGILAGDRSTLGTQAYFALRDLGFPADAEAALGAAQAEER